MFVLIMLKPKSIARMNKRMKQDKFRKFAKRMGKRMFTSRVKKQLW